MYSILAWTAVLQLLWWHSIFLSSYWLTNFVRISRVPIGVQYTSLNEQLCWSEGTRLSRLLFGWHILSEFPEFLLVDTFWTADTFGENLPSSYWWTCTAVLKWWHNNFPPPYWPIHFLRVPIGGPEQLCWSAGRATCSRSDRQRPSAEEPRPTPAQLKDKQFTIESIILYQYTVEKAIYCCMALSQWPAKSTFLNSVWLVVSVSQTVACNGKINTIVTIYS